MDPMLTLEEEAEGARPAPASPVATPRGSPLRFRLWQALRETTSIVVGVLIALAANSWWEHRQERAREITDLRLLLSTTAENQLRTDRAIAEDSLSKELAESLLLLLRSSLSLPLSDSLTDAAYRAAWFSDYHPLTAAYAALANSGELGLIRSDSLRAEIIRVAGELAGAEQQIRTYDDTAVRIAADFVRFFDVVASAGRFNAADSVLAFRRPLASRQGPMSDVAWASLQRSPDFERGAFLIWTNAANRLLVLHRVRSQLSSLSSRLSNTLEGMGAQVEPE